MRPGAKHHASLHQTSINFSFAIFYACCAMTKKVVEHQSSGRVTFSKVKMHTCGGACFQADAPQPLFAHF